MLLTEKQLAAGLEAVGQFLHEDEWEIFNEWQKYEIRKRFQDWLLPFIIKIPDFGTAELVMKDFYYEEFWDTAESFLIGKMRKLRIFDQSTDKELKLRIPKEDIDEACRNFTALIVAFLTSVENFVDEKKAEGPTLTELANSWENINLNKELKDLLKENDL